MIPSTANDEWYYYGGYKGVIESGQPRNQCGNDRDYRICSLELDRRLRRNWLRVYRGSTAGGEGVFFQVATNSFTDTGAAGTAGSLHQRCYEYFSRSEYATTATPSTTGGTLAAGTYYYKVTATVAGCVARQH